MWTCPTCKEKIEDTFDACWNCSSSTEANAKLQSPTGVEATANMLSLQEDESAGKIKELGVFAIGIGMIFGALILYVNQIAPARRPVNQLFIPLAIPATFVVAGILTLLVRRKPIIILTTSLVIIGFAVDLLLALNLVKALISVAASLLVLKTARLALLESKLNLANKNKTQ